MSSTNLELVRSIVGAWERGDYSSAEWARPGIEYVCADGPTPGSWRGLDGLTEGTRDFVNAFENLRMQADAYRELDDQRVLVLVHYSGRGKRSGLDLERMGTHGAVLFELREGAVERIERFNSQQRALADLGLAPDVPEPQRP